MNLPLRHSCRFAWGIVPLLFVMAFLAAPLCRAAPKATLEVRSDVYVFPADPLATSREVPSRVPPRRFAEIDGAIPADLAQRIDQTWGPSPWTIPQMLEIFDVFWSRIDWGFACFQGLDVDWAALRSAAVSEIEAGVSRGRFAAIMNHTAFALRESHTVAWDSGVNYSPLRPGVPLLVVGGWGNNQHFGAGLTPQPDGSLLVYKAMPNHPLGLVPGDIVIGYDGVPWKHLYPELLAAQLPLTGWWWGSSESSWTHSMLMSAGLNWHLFDTIDVVKHDTGEIVHLSVAPLATTPRGPLDCTEQLPVPGVPMPDWMGSNDPVSWGIVEGTQVGYVYVRAWTGDAGDQFFAAVSSLLTQYDTSGLIFDFRTNYGGNMFLAYPGLSGLFYGRTFTISFSRRCDAANHFAMCTAANPINYAINGSAPAHYDRPIAVLVGPGAVSSGDQVAHLFTFHPQARLFGKSTSTAFNAPETTFLGAEWYSAYAAFDAYRLTDPGNYLTHDELHVDEAVWLTPDDVALGRDTVVESALHWILNASPASSAVPTTIDAPPSLFTPTSAVHASSANVCNSLK